MMILRLNRLNQLIIGIQHTCTHVRTVHFVLFLIYRCVRFAFNQVMYFA